MKTQLTPQQREAALKERDRLRAELIQGAKDGIVRVRKLMNTIREFIRFLYGWLAVCVISFIGYQAITRFIFNDHSWLWIDTLALAVVSGFAVAILWTLRSAYKHRRDARAMHDFYQETLRETLATPEKRSKS